ncbi:hypothetical protein QRD40_10680 [Comamonas sp. Y6]|uniref:Uncharacterized protein n=1 Tax=Comamonas resistens TaxID=3046670 RepID=A0ABY8SY23_9BURK|nr:hypothetical protein [Comamonas resistens]WHS67121.1 hypothetical protein QMY55_08395 [Comamonas resistens]
MPSPIQLQRLPRRKKPANKRALLFLALLILLVCSALSGCSAQAADTPATTAADLKRAAAGAWLCPGMHAEWLDAQTVQCLKEKP